MAESVSISKDSDKSAQYAELAPQISSLLTDEPDLVANLANVAAVLKEVFGFFWVGFYLMKEDELVLGPFQGPLACTRIALGRGVCGTVAVEKKTRLVPDVHAFPGHIACSSASRSEVVVPLLRGDQLLGVLDVDSDRLDDFGQDDVVGLENLMKVVVEKCVF